MEELIIKERETKQKLIDSINKSGLPAFMLRPILKELYNALANVEEQQYSQAQQVIQARQEKERKKEGGI